MLWIKYNIKVEYNYYNFKNNKYYFCVLKINNVFIYVDYIDKTNIKSLFELKLREYFAKKNDMLYLIIFSGESVHKKIIEFCYDNNISIKENNRIQKVNNLFYSNKLFNMFIDDLYRFILLCKRLKINKFNSSDIKLNLFLNNVFNFYQQKLKEKNCIDFEDMVIMATKSLNKCKDYPKYIIVDEYQDISYERFLFIKKIIEISNSNLIVVGDDWQTIYSFAGSNINLFFNFKKLLGVNEVKIIKINKTYRNSQDLINVAGKFIMKNDLQIKKNLVSNKRLNNPIKLFYYSNNNEKIKKLKIILNKIYITNNNHKVLILLRYKFDIKFLFNQPDFILKDKVLIYKRYPNMNISYMTVHAAKGLGCDQVIIVNNEDGIYGFPSNKEDSLFIKLLDNHTKKDILDEERRLFYVALTRTKNNVYLLINKYNPSIFIKELKD